MAQHDYVIANGTGAAVRSDLNNGLAAIVSQNSGSSAPATTYAYMTWADTTAGVMKMRNGANNAWITLYQLDGEWSTIAFENGSAAAPSIYFKDSGTDTGIYSPGADQVAISTGGSGRLFIDSSGRLGVGTSSPSSQFVVSNGGAAGLEISPTGVASAPALVSYNRSGSAYTQLTYDSAQHVFNVSATEKTRIDSSGRLLVGTSTARSNFFNTAGSAPQQLQVEGATGNTCSLSSICSVADTSGGRLLLAHQRSGGVGGNTILNSGDQVGYITFQGNDGGEFVECASIEAIVDGTPGANDMPGRLVFSTTADGAASPTERFRISSDGSFSSVIPGGSTLYPSFDCRAWVNFNGTGTVAIRGSGNVSSITDNGTGDYTVNFTTAMADVNYSLVANSSNSGNGSIDDYSGISAHGANSYLAGSVRIGCVRWRFDFQVMFDSPIVSVSIFR